MASEATGIGIIGCGNISSAYFKGCQLYDGVEVVACADIDPAAAERRAEEYGVRAMDVDALLACDEAQIAVNLTTPPHHAPVNKRILEAGKRAYCEKPFATNRAEGREVLELAKRRGLYVGGAPDTFLAGAFQTARQLVQEGAIGEPFAAGATMTCGGHESWHPNPEFYYEKGGGPLLDMGPYYLTVLVNCLGPVASVTGAAKSVYEERVIGSEPLKGTKIQVETPTHLTGILEFERGATALTLFSFDMRAKRDLPQLQIYGTEGSLSLPDPNRFDGALRIARNGQKDWEEVPIRHRYEGTRGLGVAEMAAAIRAGRGHRCSGEMAYHVFDVMASYEESSLEGRRLEVGSRFEERPAMSATTSAKPEF